MRRPRGPNLLSEAGAWALAARLRDHWHEQGYEIEAWVEAVRTESKENRHIWVVRTNLVGGLPPRAA
jgi:hypothetical protein